MKRIKCKYFRLTNILVLNRKKMNDQMGII